MSKSEFCMQVGMLCNDYYGVEDGGDLCWNLIDLGVVFENEGVKVAARIVAQHMLQA